MTGTLLSLAAIFSQLSLLAFGGGNTILPEMQRQVVQVHDWMTKADFSALFALAQAAPGPNMMVVMLIGWHVAGWPGVLVIDREIRAVIAGDDSRAARVGALQGPAVAALCADRARADYGGPRVGERVVDRVLVGITVIVALVSYRMKMHPLWLLAAGALVRLSGVGQ